MLLCLVVVLGTLSSGQQFRGDESWNSADAIASRLKSSLNSVQNAPKREIPTALQPASGGSGALAKPMEINAHTFAAMYEDNKELWADLTPREAQFNYVRAHTGNVDSARLLMEFSMLPSVKYGSGSKLADAATQGKLDEVVKILDDVDTSGGALTVVDEEREDGTTPLITAAMMGHAHIVKLLLEEGANTEATGINGATALQVAASMGHVEVLEVLLKHGANPDAQHKFAQSTALHFAAEMGKPEAIEVLCKFGATVDAAKKHGGTPLHAAADSNQTEATIALLKCGADPEAKLLGDTTALYLAAQKGFKQVTAALLEHGVNKNYVMPTVTDVPGRALTKTAPPVVPEKKDSSSSSSELSHTEAQWLDMFANSNQPGSDPNAAGFELGNGATAIHAAVENGHYDTVKLLLDQGVSQQSSMEGASPLYIAAQYNHPKIAELLLKHGADVDERMKTNGHSSLYVACGSGYLTVIDVLVRHHANVNIKTHMGATSLFYAAGMGRVNVVEKLLQAGADPNISAKDGTTPLHTAVESGRIEIVQALLSHGAHPDQPGADNQTPLMIACQNKRDLIGEVLLSTPMPSGSSRSTVDVNARVESTGATPLMMAAKTGSRRLVFLLVQRGAEIDARATEQLYGASPIYLAAQNGHLEVVDFLLQKGANVHSRLTLGITPLAVAAERGHLAVVKLLCKNGAAVEMKSTEGLTAFAFAALSNRMEIMEYLHKKRGAKIDVENKEGQTPLIKAVQNRRTPLVEFLLKLGANAKKQTSAGVSALSVAQAKRDFDMTKLLGKYTEI
eukprot:m.60490 g.60490  ORF g.60490 m.60490 type:complete len:793 (-) comp19191_c2_seq3:30-2408(-)